MSCRVVWTLRGNMIAAEAEVLCCFWFGQGPTKQRDRGGLVLSICIRFALAGAAHSGRGPVAHAPLFTPTDQGRSLLRSLGEGEGLSGAHRAVPALLLASPSNPGNPTEGATLIRPLRRKPKPACWSVFLALSSCASAPLQASLSVAFGQRAPNRSAGREEGRGLGSSMKGGAGTAPAPRRDDPRCDRYPASNQ